MSDLLEATLSGRASDTLPMLDSGPLRGPKSAPAPSRASASLPQSAPAPSRASASLPQSAPAPSRASASLPRSAPAPSRASASPPPRLEPQPLQQSVLTSPPHSATRFAPAPRPAPGQDRPPDSPLPSGVPVLSDPLPVPHLARAPQSVLTSPPRAAPRFAPAPRSTQASGTRLATRRRRRNPAAVFYVRADSDDSTGNSQNPSAPRPQLPEKSPADARGEDLKGLIRNAQRVSLDVAQKAISGLWDALRDFLRPTLRSKWNINALLFVFFLTVFMLLVNVAHKQMRWLTGMLTYESEQTLVIAASVSKQLHAKTQEAKALTQSGRETHRAHAKVIDEVRELTRLRDTMLRKLHSCMGYEGPVEDIQFLLDEHIAYEANLARVVREELQWLEMLRLDYLQKARHTAAESERNESRKNVQSVAVVETAEEMEMETLENDTEAPSESLTLHSHNRIFTAIVLLLLVALYLRLA